MALVSPGVEITIVDESQYLPSAPASVPLILLATAGNKANGEGTGVAAGTLASNANKLYRLTSQRDLTTLFGNPFFYKTTNGTPLQGYELNEYGLLSAFSVLGTTNLCYVLRADIDLATLVGRTGRPSGAVPNGTYWLDISQLATTWGIHEFDRVTGTFNAKAPIIINDSEDLVNGASGEGQPLSSIGNVGDYAVTFRTESTSNRTDAAKPSLYDTFWYKAAIPGAVPARGEWVAVGSHDWMKMWPTVQATKTNPAVTTPPVGGNVVLLVINGVVVELAVGDVLSVIVQKINNMQIPFVEAKAINNRLELFVSNDKGAGVRPDLQMKQVTMVDTILTDRSDYYTVSDEILLYAKDDADPASARINGVLVTFDTPDTENADTALQDFARVPQIIDSINEAMSDAGVTDIIAIPIDEDQGVRIMNISGGAITIENVVSDKNDVAFAGADSATGIPLSTQPFTSLSTDLGILFTKNYNPVELLYGTNAQQPTKWRSTAVAANTGSTEGRPTGSVWIKTNAVNNGANMVVRQYNSALETYNTILCPLGSNDWSLTNTLDSAGGKNIPAGALYAQYGFDGEDFNAPLQFFRRATAGQSVFVAALPANFEFTTNSTIRVRVSQPNSGTLSTEYQISVASGDDIYEFATNWLNARIPNTKAEVTSAGSLVLTHTEGGVIVLDDQDQTNSAVTQLGFVVGNTPANNSTLTKWGPYKTRTFAGITHTAITNGSGATFSIETKGYTVTATTVTSGGTGYLSNGTGEIILTLPLGAGGSESQYTLRATVVGGVVVGAEWHSGLAAPSYSVLLSPWVPMNYIPSPIAPSVYPTNGTTWYFSSINQVDIMANVGGAWRGYRTVSFDDKGMPTDSTAQNPAGRTDPNGPILSAEAPETQSSGAPLVYGDLWLDTNDLENYPSLSRWQDVDGIAQWIKIDNTDQTTENGIVFADARWGSTGTEDPIFDMMPGISTLLQSNYVDPDVVDAEAYPQGTLLFNTRRSGYNVKEFRTNYFNTADFPDMTLPQEKSTWVTVSGNKTDGSPYMGRKAQRIMVVKALKATLDANSQIREEDTFFNLLAAPGYPELQPNLVVLNNDRNQTAYIIGDTPMRLADDANEIVGWATNRAGATGTGEDGLVTRNTFMGLYYPSGITTDPTGAEVVVPSSHMIMRTMIYNDTVAYPWFAPAGQRRGIIDNANNIGFISKETGEFTSIKNRAALRNVEYTNFINPISYFTNLGLLNFGNKNSFDSQSALDRTNVARLVCYLRWNLQIALRPFIFEPNDNITRSQARSVVQTLMADIQTKRGIYDYLVVCDESNNTPARIDRNELWVDVAIEPVKAAEFIYVPVRILNTGEISGG